MTFTSAEILSFSFLAGYTILSSGNRLRKGLFRRRLFFALSFVRLEDVLLIRHAFRPGDPSALRGPEDLNEELVLAYTREQGLSPRQFPPDPPRYWVILVADGKRRSRLWGSFENHGEVMAERTGVNRFFDLRMSGFLAALTGRLVIEWDSRETGTDAPPAPRICQCWKSPTGTRFSSRDSTA
ncbi:hypothetical protein [Arthrobacter sp. TS-15]|uniref:hypothetical protein n=1 Tax=Arthrobacter sp. TS-15 TaxID=2510797 RepID=UPI00193101DC|nr:hypothetical protein [Arthrobacter sp. TS-15]